MVFAAQTLNALLVFARAQVLRPPLLLQPMKDTANFKVPKVLVPFLPSVLLDSVLLQEAVKGITLDNPAQALINASNTVHPMV